MLLHFACRHCGRALFAQEQFAGRLVKCPRCLGENTIPALPGGAAETSQSQGTDAEAPAARGGITVPAQGLISAAAPSQTPDRDGRADPTLLDMEKGPDGGVVQQEPRAPSRAGEPGEAPAAPPLASSEGMQVWYVLAACATAATAGWLLLLTASVWEKGPRGLVVCNVLLALGLLWNIRNMLGGYESAFFVAALVIALCMPLEAAFGLRVVDAATLAEFRRYDPQRYASITVDKLNTGFLVFFSIVGALMSIPAWIAGMKLDESKQAQAAAEKQP